MHAIKEFRKQVDVVNVVPCSISSLEKDIWLLIPLLSRCVGLVPEADKGLSRWDSTWASKSIDYSQIQFARDLENRCRVRKHAGTPRLEGARCCQMSVIYWSPQSMLCRGLALPVASERHMYITQCKITVIRQLEICQRNYQRLQSCCTLADFTNATASVAGSVASWSQHGAGLRSGIPVTVFLVA